MGDLNRVPNGCKLALPLCLLGLLGACSKTERLLVVGSKASIEQVFLAEVAASHLERKLGIKVARKYKWGETIAVHTGLVGGEIDLYPEYGCIALPVMLRAQMDTDRNSMLERLRDEYARRFRAVWLDPLGFDGRCQVAVRRSDAEKFKMTKMSDLALRKEGWRVGVTREFRARKDGFPLLDAKYHINLRTPPAAMEPAMFPRALTEDTIDLILAGATDIVWANDDLRILEDDAGAFPPCEVSFVLRSDADQAYPGVRRTLAELSGKFTLETVRAANIRLSDGRVAVESVAEGFLREAGLLR